MGENNLYYGLSPAGYMQSNTPLNLDYSVGSALLKGPGINYNSISSPASGIGYSLADDAKSTAENATSAAASATGGANGNSWWGDIKGAFSDDGKGANFGRNLLGAGQLGLGLMSYLEQKPMMEKQNRLLDQQIANNEREGAARQATRDALSAKV